MQKHFRSRNLYIHNWEWKHILFIIIIRLSCLTISSQSISHFTHNFTVCSRYTQFNLCNPKITLGNWHFSIARPHSPRSHNSQFNTSETFTQQNDESRVVFADATARSLNDRFCDSQRARRRRANRDRCASRDKRLPHLFIFLLIAQNCKINQGT